ncbi:MAG: NAD-dependent epimerase/dehydratase family protein [Elusimicrobiota bacterium]
MNAFVTGGAGFIGSHIVDRLIRGGRRVTVYDNLSTGRRLFLRRHRGQARLRFVRGDILDEARLRRAMRGHDTVFHFAANADVRGGVRDTRVDLEQNTIGTHRVLEAMRRTGARRVVFASSATVYGEPERFPTPEDAPLIQTSLYGAAKASAEHLIEAYGNYFGIQGRIFRFVSWVGERYTHGVVCDFVRKLRRSPRALEIMGDGRQRKSYLDVRDGIAGIFAALRSGKGRTQVYNLGHRGVLTVDAVADIVRAEMGLGSVRYRHTGGVRGWPGDSPVVLLDTRRIRALGWRPKVPIPDGIRATVRYLLDHEELLRPGG